MLGVSWHLIFINTLQLHRCSPVGTDCFEHVNKVTKTTATKKKVKIAPNITGRHSGVDVQLPSSLTYVLD